MIDQVDQSIRHWISSVVGDIAVTNLLAPTDILYPSVSVYLLQIIPQLPEQPQARRRPPLKVLLRYLITTYAEDEAAAHHLLGQLVFAALENSTDFQVELTPLALADWQALGLIPRPGFMINVPLTQARPETPAKPVLQPPVIRMTTPIRLYGLLLGPDHTPLAGATIELPDMQYITETDTRGRFAFPAMPDPALYKQQVVIRAKGQEQSFILDQGKPDNNQVIIHFNLAL